MNTITTVFFDIDNTLFNHIGSQRVALEQLRKLHFPYLQQDEFRETWIDFQERFWIRYLRKEISHTQQRTERIAEVWKFFGKTLTDEEINDVQQFYYMSYEQAWKSFPDVLEVLEFLHKKGIQMGVISNGNKSLQLKKLNHMGIAQYFINDLSFISEDIGLSKPDPQLFLLAQKKAKALPENILFIGDDPIFDIAPAKKLRWKTLLIDYFGKYPDQPSIKNLQEVRLMLQ